MSMMERGEMATTGQEKDMEPAVPRSVEGGPEPGAESVMRDAHLAAAEELEKHGNLTMAADRYDLAGDTEHANELRIRAAEQAKDEGDYEQAGKLYELAGDKKKAQAVYEWAAGEWENRGMYRIAANIYSMLIGDETEAERLRKLSEQFEGISKVYYDDSGRQIFFPKLSEEESQL